MKGAHVAADRVLVIGASSDYIDYIGMNRPSRVLFVTDPRVRAEGNEQPPLSEHELLTPLVDPECVLEGIRRHLKRFDLHPIGIACFDDESMYLAALLAQGLGLPYPAPEAVLRCRCKLRSKQLWQQAGLDCPACAEITSPRDAANFFLRHGTTVLKPLTGAGSELLFICRTPEECGEAWRTMRERLAAMPDERLYAPYRLDGRQVDPRACFIAEQFRDGDEYSCDILLDGDRLEIIRLTRKYPLDTVSDGATLAYQLLDRSPFGLQPLCRVLRRATRVLGVTGGICMVDFLVDDGGIVLLELAPRPGGDCLPPLLRAGLGLDIIGLTLDHAAGLPVQLPDRVQQPGLTGLRLFAPRPGGVIAGLGIRELQDDPRVQNITLTSQIGRRVIQPPEDYFSRILGHALFIPDPGPPVQQQCRDLLDLLKVSYAEPAP